MAHVKVYFIGNYNVIEVEDLFDVVSDTYINDATVTAILYNTDGEEVVGVVWPLTLFYVEGSTGVYRNTVFGLDVSNYEDLLLHIDIEIESQIVGHREYPVVAIVRGV